MPEIEPEPSFAEQQAIEEALARLAAPAPEPPSPWWRAGIREAVSPGEEPD